MFTFRITPREAAMAALIAAVALLATPRCAAGQAAAEVPATVFGEVRARSNWDHGIVAPAHASTHLRSRLGVRVDASPNARVLPQVPDSRVPGAEGSVRPPRRLLKPSSRDHSTTHTHESMKTDPSPGAARVEAVQTVNEVLQLHPRTVAVFNALAIDACCGGDRTLAAAAREDGVQLEALLSALRSSLDDEVQA